MFAKNSGKAIAIRIILIAVILFNAFDPMAAFAKPAPISKTNPPINTKKLSSLPEQQPQYFGAPQFPYSQLKISPNSDKPKSHVPAKDQVEFTFVADPSVVPANGLVNFKVTIHNNSNQILTNLHIFTDSLENGLILFYN